jgi:hypothetical protein
LQLRSVRVAVQAAQHFPGSLDPPQFLDQSAQLSAVAVRERLPDRMLQLLHTFLECNQMLMHTGMLAATHPFPFSSRFIVAGFPFERQADLVCDFRQIPGGSPGRPRSFVWVNMMRRARANTDDPGR